MKPTRIIIEFADGSIRYTDSEAEIRTIGLALPRSIKWITGSGIKALRNKYFAMLSELRKNKEDARGYTKADLHESLKPLVMKAFAEMPQYFTNEQPEYSTKNLNREGWIAYIEQFKSIINDIYGYIFND